MSGAAPHVLMSADAVGGVWTYALDLATAFAARRIRTTLALLGPVPVQALIGARGDPRVVRLDAPLDWLAASPADARRGRDAFARLCDELKPDLAHLNAPSLAETRLGAPTVGFCHSCLETWWRAVRTGPAPADFDWRTQLLRAGMRNCDALMAPSVAFAEATAAAHGSPRPRVARNGRSEPTTPPTARVAGFAFAAGRLWDEGKDIATLDAAAARSGIEVFAAGPVEGPQGQLMSLEHARALGALPAQDVAGWLARRPMFVSCSLYEPFGLAALEAAMSGCPLILSDIATHRELWDGAACFFAPRDAGALAALLRHLVQDRAGVEELGTKARRRARDYSVNAMAEATLRAYAEISPVFARFAREAA